VRKKAMDAKRKEAIVQAIRKHFDHLFEMGYELTRIERTGNMGAWRAELLSEELAFRLFSDRGEWFLSISPAREECWIGLAVAVYLITGGKDLPAAFAGDLFKEEDKQFLRLGQLLRKYFGEIRSIFVEQFPAHKDQLLSLRKEVNAIQLKRFLANQ
jgi:hypothetical protein